MSFWERAHRPMPAPPVAPKPTKQTDPVASAVRETIQHEERYGGGVARDGRERRRRSKGRGAGGGAGK